MSPPEPFATLAEISGPRPAQGERPAAGPVYVVNYAANGPPPLGAETLRELFEHSVAAHGDLHCLGWRKIEDGQAGDYEYITYKETAERVAAVHAALEGLGLQPGDRVGIIGPNAPEWQMALQAMNRMNGCCVPLYDTLGDAAVAYIVKHAEVKLVVAHAAKLPILSAMAAKGGAEGLTGGVVYWGTAEEKALQDCKAAGLRLLTWQELVESGKAKPVQARQANTDDVCTIMYTSGTTGNPKGVVLTHRAVMSTIAGLKSFLEHIGGKVDMSLGPKDVYFSFLTMAHIFGRVAEEFMLHIGATVGYWQGDARKMMDDLAALKPTIFAGVPRVFERVYSGVQDQIKKGSWLKRTVFNYAYHRKLFWMKAGYRHDHASRVSDMLVFNKIKDKLGGRVRIIVTGGAPIPAHVEEFLKVAMCAPVVQGYGLTETCAASFLSDPFDWDQNFTVGPPMPHTELRLEACPELGYDPSATPPRGEVVIRGQGIFKGYYHEEQMTKEVLDEDGFFHTGDIGEIMPSGALRLIDRKKNLFKLSHGEYIAVERVENVYKASEVVEQLWIYGNSFESCLVAVLVPREGPLRKLAEEANVSDASNKPLKELLSDPAVKKAVLAQLKTTGKAGKLKGFEEIKDVYLEEEPFSVENDCMTPSFKLKRPQLQKRYQAKINAMYDALKKAGQA